MTEDKDIRTPDHTPESDGESGFITKAEVLTIVQEFSKITDEKIEAHRKETLDKFAEVSGTTQGTYDIVKRMHAGMGSKNANNITTALTGIVVIIIMRLINHFFG